MSGTPSWAREQCRSLRGGTGTSRPPSQPPRLFHSVASGHAADGGITNPPGNTLYFPASRASVLRPEIHGPRQALGCASSGPCRGGDRKGEARTETADSEFRAMLLGVAEPGGGSLVQCHGGSASDCTAPPRWSQIVYTSISSCDLRRCSAQKVGIRRTSREFPPQLAVQPPFPLAPPPGEPAARRPGKEVIPGTCHGSAEVSVTKALARSERAAARRTLPRPAARFIPGPKTVLARPPILPGLAGPLILPGLSSLRSCRPGRPPPAGLGSRHPAAWFCPGRGHPHARPPIPAGPLGDKPTSPGELTGLLTRQLRSAPARNPQARGADHRPGAPAQPSG
jgi:hypothetical protein